MDTITVHHEALHREVTIGREVGRWGTFDDADAPLLLVMAGVHGNEPAGVIAAVDVLEELAEQSPAIEPRGGVVMLAGNLPALDTGERFVHEDLNRCAHEDTVVDLRSHGGAVEGVANNEEKQLLAIMNAADALAEGHRGPRFVIDIHTTSGEGPAWISVFDLPGCVDFASKFPIHAAVGLEAALHGTVIELLNHRGWAGFTLEAGRHTDLASVEHAHATIWHGLWASGIVDGDDLPDGVERSRPQDVLHRNALDGPRQFDIVHRHAIGPSDTFKMRPGFVNFQPVEEGQPLADDRRGEVKSPVEGRILMPLYQPLGEDGFFVVREREGAASCVVPAPSES